MLAIFGFADTSCVKVEDFSLGSEVVCIGDELSFSFTIETEKTVKVRLEYGLDYVKANGRRNRKIFQISELTINGKKAYTKNHSFADTSTRKHYPGIHAITLIVNGVERGTLDFEVLPAK